MVSGTTQSTHPLSEGSHKCGRELRICIILFEPDTEALKHGIAQAPCFGVIACNDVRVRLIPFVASWTSVVVPYFPSASYATNGDHMCHPVHQKMLSIKG